MDQGVSPHHHLVFLHYGLFFADSHTQLSPFVGIHPFLALLLSSLQVPACTLRYVSLLENQDLKRLP